MKKYFLLFILIFSYQNSFSQKNSSRAVYLDSVFRETTKENHKYIRLVEDYQTIKDRYQVAEFYKSGAKKMVGTTLDRDYLKKDGTFVYFYENGTKEAVVVYSEGWKTGKEFKWYENGNMKFEKENTSDIKAKSTKSLLLKFWNKSNELTVVDGNGECEDINENYAEKGRIENGLKQGKWEGKDLQHKIAYTEFYDKGNLVSGISTDKDSTKYSYSKLFENPVPKTGMNNFYKYIAQNYKTPTEAFKNKVTGQIYISFIVNEAGKITKPIIIKDLGYGTGIEAVKVLDDAGEWVPGKFRGIKREALYSIPITINGR
ncbi:energy transducer TonB [Flavobacterium sp. 17A]|uniref:Energy transducer TonB n=1 Tax=Flavobacterium potami TaxID=2872310 RepID=A0A9X1HCF1_9FLAO|nr:energy transducer TonB [Flavobacterium potami]MBZ4036256.1 energy transducer TonB [Flavobacterium potami]